MSCASREHLVSTHSQFERIRRTPDEDEAAKQRRQERIAKLEEAIAVGVSCVDEW